MAVDPGALDATLAAAVGDDPALVAELRAAFLDSAAAALAAARDAMDDATRAGALRRLAGLAASFGATRLLGAAQLAAERPDDTAAIARLEQMVARLG